MKIYPVVLDSPGRIYVIEHPHGFMVLATFPTFDAASTAWTNKPRMKSVAGELWTNIPAEFRGASDFFDDPRGGRWVRIRPDLVVENFRVTVEV